MVMYMSNAANHIKRYANNEKKFNDSKVSDWGQCQAYDCRLASTVKTSMELCQFHHGKDMGIWRSITQAIANNSGLIQKYTEMAYKSSSQWNLNAMMGWDVLPMLENEPPTIYLNRFHKWVHEEIDKAARELAQ